MNYRNQLLRESEDAKMALIFSKISEKLKELGFIRASDSVKTKIGNKGISGEYSISQKRKNDVIEISNKCWHSGKQKHETAKQKKKSRVAAPALSL
ncbi:hypothetical protein [Flammeovirga agarivorans]|uniref:Uncharacterized protein n=1 Tax=Flammeovirga agarivorans TaxID=2726742 RepID=A0A7X8SLT5_9BACT|nr:hypothetical protein [Flammeovirga agarivorans]NLR92601.1 hypothetical protein [Flammeovirga agarivorans]